jgi:hypothetical protein
VCGLICPKDEGCYNGNPTPSKGAVCMAEEDSPKKGRPPPGGEEAEVVVYQPRGVGLMHTRHKPSDIHYTHGNRCGRKCRA